MTHYVDQAYDCLDEHERRFRRLPPEDKQRARAWTRKDEPRLDVALDATRGAYAKQAAAAVEGEHWKEAVNVLVKLVAVDAKLDLIREVCDEVP